MKDKLGVQFNEQPDEHFNLSVEAGYSLVSHTLNTFGWYVYRQNLIQVDGSYFLLANPTRAD